MIKNNQTHYGLVSMGLHWLMAITFIGLFAFGLYMVELDYYDPWYHQAPDLHKSIGITMVLLMIFRFVWNVSQTKPNARDANTISNQAAHWAHRFFYVLVLMLFISGYLISTAKGKPIDVFGLFEVPAVFSEDSKRGDLAGDIHFYIASSFIFLATVHAAAALYHHFYLKDSVLKRMLTIKKIITVRRKP